MSTPTVVRYHTTEYQSQAHGDEFIVVVDSLGRRWNPLLHPRDENGRFIRTFSFVTFKMPGGGGASGRVSGIDRDGNLLVKVQGTLPGTDPRVTEGGYVKVPHDKVAVRTVKAQLSGPGSHVGILQKQENDSVSTSIRNLRRLGMNDQADKMEEAQRLAMAPPDPRDPKSHADKQRAIDLFREVGEAADDERGKGFSEGDDYEEVKANLSPDEISKLQTLDAVTKTSFTARHSLGDNTIDVENDEGQLTGNKPEVRIEAAENELSKDYAEDAPVWDITSGSIAQGQLEKPVKAEVRDQVAEQQGTGGLPELWRSAYQKLRTGTNRLAGYKQAMQVAPGDRHHVDKNGDEVRVGHVVHVDATKSRGEFDGIVSRIYTDAKGQKHIYGRDFDPTGEKGYQDRYGQDYHDWSVQGKSIELASDDQQSTLFQQLALQGQDAASKSLVKSFTEEYIAAMQRRYATPDAKKISGGFFDVVPIHLREKKDANGEMMRIGDAVQGPNGEDGFISYLEPNANTTKVYWHNGKSSRLTSNKLKRMHGATSEVYPEDSAPGTNNYVPTREEAAQAADEMGADSVAQVIRDGADASTIQSAMITNVAFQGQLDSVNALYNKRDQTRSAGQELNDEDKAKLDQWDRLFMASAGYFREPNDPPPTPPEPPAPDPEMEAEGPGSPGNPTEHVTPGGTTVRTEGDSVIVDNNTEDPIDAGDPNAVEQAVTEAESGQQPEAPPETPETPPVEAGPQALADKLASDIGRLVEEAKQAPHVDQNQRTQLDQLNSRLADAVAAKDGPAVVRSLESLTGMINRQVNGNLHQTRLRAVLNGRATNNVPMHQFVQSKLDAGDDIFSAAPSAPRPDRPVETPSEVPEGVDPKVDSVDNALSEALTLDDGSTMVMVGDQIVDEGFYVMDPDTITEYDNEPTTKDIADFLNQTQGSDHEGISVWYDEADGRYRMARVSIHDNEQDAAGAADLSGTNQYVNIADGSVMNVALGGDKNTPTEAVEDPRSEARHVRTSGTGKASARTTSKQKSMLDHVAGVEGADPEISRITDAVKNGEEITGADASRLADYVDGLDAGQFDKPSDKGVASQMAHRLARASGEEGARGYSSQNTALRRTSDTGISLTAQSQDPQVRTLMDGARDDIKNGDNAAAAQKFRDAADIYDAEGHTRDDPSRRAREHADRLDAMGGTTAPPTEPPAPAEAPPGEPGSPSEVLDQLFAQIGQPEDYGTEAQGRLLGQARSYAGEGLNEDAAKAVEQAAAMAPDGPEKQAMLDAASALRAMPEGGGGGTPLPPDQGSAGGPPTPEEINDILANADSALESERQAEGENGPQGWNATADELNGQLLDLMKMVKANPNDTALATELRALAREMDNNFRLTDAGPFVDELNDLADRIDAGGNPPTAPGEAPPTPPDVGGGAPFRVDQPDAIRNALLDDEQLKQLDQHESDYLSESLTGLKRLLDQVEEGSVANKEVNNAKFLAMKRFNGAVAMRENLADKLRRTGELTPEDINRELNVFGDDAQHILDIWNGTADHGLSAEKLTDFMSQRVDAAAAAAREEANGASDEGAPLGLRMLRTNMETGSSEAANRMDDNRVQDLPQYTQLVTEMASILSTAQALRDPANRASLRPDQIRDISMMMRRLEADSMQARQFFDAMKEQGFDTSSLESALQEQLTKFDADHLLDNTKLLPQDLVAKGNEIGKSYRAKLEAGQPALNEATAFLESFRDLLAAVKSPAIHNQLAPAIKRIITDQTGANGGSIPDPIAKVMEDPEWQRFGAFSDVLGRIDIENMVKSGAVDDLSAATGGRYTAIDWEDAPEISPDLISDDRPEGSGSVEADMAWREGQAMVTPNVSSALNSMFSAMGGSVHRVQSDITQADVPDAERWKADGWNRAGSDIRTPDQVEGVYTKDSNLVVVADSRMIADTGRGSNVLVHELGHALDSMLGETLAEGGWFTEHDPEFKKFHAALKKTAQYGPDPEQSLMHWYFRNASEGAIKHNGSNGHKEIFAEGYAAYATAAQRLQNLPEGSGPVTEETQYVLLARQLTGDRGHLVEWADEQTFEQVREREAEMGHAIFDFFHTLETERLPQIMAEPKAIPVRSELRTAILGLEQGYSPATPQQKRATAEQKKLAQSHNSRQHGVISMTPVERGTPEWTQMEAAVKQVSPGASMPPPTALYVTWNPQFAEQGTSVIWKAVMPGQPKYVVEYTDQHKATQLASKFQRQQRVNTALDEVHAKAEAEALYDETAALVLAMIETGMRVGSSEKAGTRSKTTGRVSKTFGGATMQAKHVFFPSETLMRFKFPGKAGVPNTYQSRNPALRAAVIQLLEGKAPTDQLFAGTNSGRTIDYLRTATGIDDIINHDTRTRFATNMARELVAKVPKSKMPKNAAEFKKWQSGISKTVGASINDTWQVARDSYISPAVWEPLEDSAGLPHSFDDSPPLGLVEGKVVEHIGGPAVGYTPGSAPPPTGAGPTAPAEPGAPAEPVSEAGGPVAAAAGASLDAQDSTTDGPGYSLDHSPIGVAERQTWYDSYVWPDPPIIAPADTTFSEEDGDDEPAQTQPEPTQEAP